MHPTRVLHFGASVFAAQTACLGDQVATVVESIRSLIPDLSWYVADVQCTGTSFTDGAPTPVYVGDADAMIRAALQVDQFTSGVFVATPADFPQPRFRDGGLWTDDDESADLGDAVVEMRAFDTTHVSVATTHEELLRWLEKKFLVR